ncbi:MAG: Fis family transcriptional regulator [Gammaproteobacteria bacterium]|nr:MAG: Fis family transcriptional regulator [Gammaproteobacteria bacterium]
MSASASTGAPAAPGEGEPLPEEGPPLAEAVRRALERYFRDLDGHSPGNLYQLVMDEVERPLLQAAMAHAGGNQTRAARLLGINRATLRKKLDRHGLS